MEVPASSIGEEKDGARVDRFNSPSSNRFYVATIVSGLALVCLVCLTAAMDVWHSRQVALQEGDRALQFVAPLLAEHIGTTISQLQAELHQKAVSIGGVPGGNDFTQFSSQIIAHIPQITALRREDDTLTPSGISLAVLLPSASGSGNIPVIAAIDCTELLSPLVRLTQDQALTLSLINNKSAQPSTCDLPRSQRAAAELVQTKQAAVPGYPWGISVSIPQNELLREWRKSAWSTLARTATISTFVLALLYVLLRQSRRQERANLELLAGKQLWRAVFDHAPVGIMMLPPNRPYMVANPAFQRMVGYTLDELNHLAPDEITHPDDIALTRAKVAELERGERSSVQFEKRYLHRSGQVIWTEISISCLSNSGDLDGILVAVVDDVSARRATEQERLRLEAQLRQSQKLEALGTFAGGIAHDFNNILSAILGYGDRAYRALSDGSPAHRHVEQVLNAGNRARLLVERILAFSRSGLTARLPVHVAPLIDETVELLKHGLAPEMTIRLQIGAPDAHISGDPTHLHQVLMNLCSNAIHALQGRGTVTVSTRQLHASVSMPLTSGTLPAGEYVCITVEDTGVGISPEIQERIFDPFFTTRKAGEGTGLGLSLVDGIVKEYGGAIGLESAIGAGTRFDIYLPLTKAPLLKATVPPNQPVPTGNGELILVVDDEPSLVALNEELLAELGYEPVGFVSAQEALIAFRADPARFDLVMTDQTMLEMAGLELLRQIRTLRPELPALLISGYSSISLEQEALHLGLVEVLRKPVDRTELARMLRRVLQM